MAAAATAAALTGAYIAVAFMDRGVAVSGAIFYLIALLVCSAAQEVSRRS